MSRSVTTLVFCVEPEPERMLRAADADAEAEAERHDAEMLADVHTVDHHRNQVQPGQVRGGQLGQRGLGRGGESVG